MFGRPETRTTAPFIILRGLALCYGHEGRHRRAGDLIGLVFCRQRGLVGVAKPIETSEDSAWCHMYPAAISAQVFFVSGVG